MDRSSLQGVKVLCFGMGAIGTYIGGSLAACGAELIFIEKKELVKGSAYRDLSLQLGRESKNVLVQVRSDLSQVLSEYTIDVALMAVKSFDTPAVLESISGLERKFPTVLCLQNGVENEELIAGKLGKERVIAGTITSAVGRVGLGAIRLEKLRGVGIEEGHLLSESLLDWFNEAGLRARGYSSRADMKWSKMLTNLMANATSAILDWTPAQVYSHPLTWNIELRQLREALEVMKAMKIKVVDLPGTPVVALMSLLQSLPEGLSQKLVGTPLAKGRGAKMPSFHIDLYGGKTISEVSFLNGAVARYARNLGLSAPVNDRLCQLLEGLAAGSFDKKIYQNSPEKLMEWIRGDR